MQAKQQWKGGMVCIRNVVAMTMTVKVLLM